MKRLLALFTVVALLAGCNTMAGFGRDVEKAGDKIEDTANKKK